MCCLDTDVLVLPLHHRESIHAKEIFLLTGHQNKYADLPIHTHVFAYSCDVPKVDKTICFSCGN